MPANRFEVRLPAAGALLLVAVISGCVDSQPNQPGDQADVDMKDNVYDPTTFDAVAGKPVTWINVGKAAHTVTVQDPDGGNGDYLYNEELIEPGESAEYAFPSPGTYDVFCIYHSQGAQGDFDGGMVMKVVVA